MIKFSKSRFELQQSCLGKYWWKYIKTQPTEETVWPATLIGETVHLYLENLLNTFIQKPSDWIEIKSKLHRWNLERLQTEYNLVGLRELFLSAFQDYKKDLVSRDESGTRIFKRNRGWKDEEFFTKYPKWLWEIVKFLFKTIESTENISSEKEFEIERQILGEQVLIRGVIDLVSGSDIVDFKTVKDSSHYYFIDWKKDIQSLAYLFAFKQLYGKTPNSFGYLVFNEIERTIIVSQVHYSKNISEYEKSFEQLLEVFVQNHRVSEDTTLWKPEKTNCFFCAHKSFCSRVVKE